LISHLETTIDIFTTAKYFESSLCKARTILSQLVAKGIAIFVDVITVKLLNQRLRANRKVTLLMRRPSKPSRIC